MSVVRGRVIGNVCTNDSGLAKSDLRSILLGRPADSGADGDALRAANRVVVTKGYRKYAAAPIASSRPTGFSRLDP